MEKSISRMLIDDAKLKMACTKIAVGIAELQNLGLSKEQILQGLERQLSEFFHERVFNEAVELAFNEPDDDDLNL